MQPACVDRPAIAVVAGVALLITPVCGALFGCGCDWPWQGLAAHCNYFDPAALRHCPWCEHVLFSAPGIVLATLIGVAPARRIARAHDPKRGGVSFGALLGLLVALAGLVLLGQATLSLTGYPPP